MRVSEFVRLPSDTIAKYKVIAGHHFYNIQSFTPRTPVYITMLRHPVERTISIYAHIRRSSPHYLHQIVKSQSLLDFVTDKRTQPQYINMQTRYIAADPPIAEIAKTLSPEAFQNLELERQIESFQTNGYSDPALLQRAQERLKQFAFVGIAEQFDASVEVLCYTFGWPIPPAPKVFNVATNRPEHEEILPEVLEIIRENTQLDAALYETGKQLFIAHYERMLKDHPEMMRRDIGFEDSETATMQRQLVLQKKLITSLEQDKAELETRIKSIENSFGWRFVLRFNTLRSKLIPPDSMIENIYLKLRGR